MHAKNFFAALDVRPGHRHPAGRTAQAAAMLDRATSGRFVAAIRMTPFVRLEAVHFDEQCVQRLLALIVSAAQTRAAVSPDGVIFIYKK